ERASQPAQLGKQTHVLCIWRSVVRHDHLLRRGRAAMVVYGTCRRYRRRRGGPPRARPQQGRGSMFRWLAGALALASAPILTQPVLAQDAPQMPDVPQIAYESVPDFLKLPNDVYLGEAAGVAVNSKGHVFVYSRGGSSVGPAFANTASQLFEF